MSFINSYHLFFFSCHSRTNDAKIFCYPMVTNESTTTGGEMEMPPWLGRLFIGGGAPLAASSRGFGTESTDGCCSGADWWLQWCRQAAAAVSLGVLMDLRNKKLHQVSFSCVYKFFCLPCYGLICLWPPFFPYFIQIWSLAFLLDSILF